MKDKMNRNEVTVGTAKELDKMDREYWTSATIKERLQTIIYLRECFYGEEATTGRFQRFYTIFKRA
jgi:hypothetical protein